MRTGSVEGAYTRCHRVSGDEHYLSPPLITLRALTSSPWQGGRSPFCLQMDRSLWQNPPCHFSHFPLLLAWHVGIKNEKCETPSVMKPAIKWSHLVLGVINGRLTGAEPHPQPPSLLPPFSTFLWLFIDFLLSSFFKSYVFVVCILSLRVFSFFFDKNFH